MNNKKRFMCRILFARKKHNTTVQITEKSLPAMLDMFGRMLRSGEAKAIQVEASR